ncbi:GntR family transcriptional regulator [Nakamurella sp. A5-74]|uniref:GntR family transcriptional regulator n=1 Tax=Nakamurella sp. A5-74 TaxID=3158264 RepID=A0AAU8DJ62_9ACTN
MTSMPGGPEPAPAGETLRARVSRELTAAVVSGELAAGTLVTVPTLAVQFGVSATPVREALLELEKRSFVEAVKNKGFRVTEVGSRELAELAEVRLLLEPPAMYRLAGHLPAQQAEEFRSLAAAMTTAIADADLATWLEADQRFHLGLTELLGNAMLVTVIGDLRGRTRLVGLAGMLASQELARSAEEHHELLDRLLTGDAAGAEALMRTHIGHTVGWWSGRAEE